MAASFGVRAIGGENTYRGAIFGKQLDLHLP